MANTNVLIHKDQVEKGQRRREEENLDPQLLGLIFQSCACMPVIYCSVPLLESGIGGLGGHATAIWHREALNLPYAIIMIWKTMQRICCHKQLKSLAHICGVQKFPIPDW